MTDCWPNNEPFVPFYYSCYLSSQQSHTLLTIFLPWKKAKRKIDKHHSSFLGTGFLQLGKPRTLYRRFWYCCITAMSLRSCFGMDKSTHFAFFFSSSCDTFSRDMWENCCCRTKTGLMFWFSTRTSAAEMKSYLAVHHCLFLPKKTRVFPGARSKPRRTSSNNNHVRSSLTILN